MNDADGAAPLTGPGRLVVISGPGGVGKGTVVAALVERHDDLTVSLSATTRPPRPGEEDGVHYSFVDDATFDRMIAEGQFLEWAEFNGHRYGTPWQSVTEDLAAGRTVICEIDVQGAMQVRERVPDAVLVFLEPPDLAALEQRLRARGADDAATVARRLEIGRAEMAHADRFDVRVVNRRVGEAVAALERILADVSARPCRS